MDTPASSAVLLDSANRVLMRRWDLSSQRAAVKLAEVADGLRLEMGDLAALVLVDDQQQRARWLRPPIRGEAARVGSGMDTTPSQALPVVAWPGSEVGLSRRETEIISLITEGLSNQEIADQIFLSINSIKGYVRTAYRKMGVTSRTRAVLWGLDHGL